MYSVISERALFGRVALKLAHEGLTLHRCRYDSRWFKDLGRYYTVDHFHNRIVHQDCSLEQMGRDMGIIGPNEVATEE